MPNPLISIGASQGDGTGEVGPRQWLQKINRLPNADSTINAGSGDYTGTTEQKITAAIAAAVAGGFKYVWIPASMLPYNPALVTSNSAVALINEGEYRPLQKDDGSVVKPGQIPVAWSVASYAAGRGPTLIDCNDSIFSGEIDPSIYIGYNLLANGSDLRTPGEPGAAWAIEGNYNDGSGQNKMEAYVQFLAGDQLTFRRPFFAQYNRTTKVMSTVRVCGNLVQIVNDDQTQNMVDFNNDGINGNFLVVDPCTYNANSFLQVKSKAAQTAIIQLGVTATNLAQFQCGIATRLDILVNNRNTAFFYATPGGGAGDAFAVGANDNSAVGLFNNTGGVGLKGVVARGIGGQTGFLFEAQSSAPATLWAITAAGNMQVGANQVVTARQTGWTAATNTKLRTTFDTTTVTLPNLAARVGALLDDLITHGLIGT